ncbi:MmyB family transcriptional regulator [Paenibacillus sp. FSL H8-0034]|uniref:MmyB family transcriptional regulator n=1 Tax=Paenibacillus sp. FSL H8-0034 TaxID=2954671 RepID=UPI0030F50AF2
MRNCAQRGFFLFREKAHKKDKRLKTGKHKLGLKRTVLALEPNPAFILGRSWDLLMWNKAAEVVFRLPAFSKGIQQRPNWLRRFLTDPSLQMNNKQDLKESCYLQGKA